MPVLTLLAVLGVAEAGLAMTPQVAAGIEFSLTLRPDGTIWVSGGNEFGQLGDGTTLQRNTPVQAGLPGNGANWRAIAAGEEHAVAIRADGTLWGWGANNFGQLGKGFADPELVPTPSPVQIGTDSDWIAAAAGASCTIALKSDGTLWAWGFNNFGQLGNGDAGGATQTSPVAVLNPGASKYVAVSITNGHVLALQADGSLWSWGGNQFGQLGINAVDITVHATPVQVVTGDSAVDNAWTGVSAGGWHSVAQQSDGTLWSWGRNSAGQLGNSSGSANNNPLPLKMGTDNDWAGYSAGNLHTTAFKRNGSLWAWGANNKGQLGIGGTVDLLRHSTPLQITSPAGISTIIVVAAGSGHSLAARANGDLYAWGDNPFGQLGTGAGVNNITASSTVPVQVAQDSIGWVAVEPGGQYTLARRTNGTLWAWGDNSSGQASLDPLTITDITTPVQVGTAESWSVFSGGLLHTAALQADGTLWTFGSNTLGQLGDGSTTDRFTPQQITVTSPAAPVNEWFAVSSGDAHTLALQSDGSLWAWGDNSAGQLGDGTIDSRLVPTRIVTGNPSNFDNNWVAVSAGGLYSVGLQADGTLWAWGDNAFGQFGVDPEDLASSPDPVQVSTLVEVPGNPGFNSSWTAVAAGFNHLVGLQANGTVWGLGDNSVGQLGTGTASAFEFAFTQVLNPGSPVIPFVAIAAGDSHSVALKADGSIWSMGNNTSGQLGVDNTGDTDPLAPVPHPTPVQESTAANDWTAVGAGGRHTVALKANGTLASWGDNAFGQLGDGTTDPKNSPTPLQEGRITVPASVSFGTVAVTVPSPVIAIPVTNSGNGSLAVTSIVVGGANAVMFTIAPSSTCTPPFTLAASGSCQVDVFFTPASSGAKSANLTIASDDAVRPAAVVELSGAGFIPFTINASAGANGTISPSGAAVTVAADGSQLFTIVPNPGARILDVVVDGISVGPVGTYLFSAITSNLHTITATFAPLTYQDSWSWRNPLPTGHSLRRVVTNGAGVHVAVGDYGTILRSTDSGATWTVIVNGGHTLNSVVFGSGKFIVVGSHGRILTSPDGVVWTPRHSGTNTELQGIAFGDSTFVTVGNTQTDPTTLQPSAPVFTSPDGVTWTARLQTLPINGVLDLHDVAFGTDGIAGNVFVAAGQGGYLLKSSDKGITWLLNGVAPIDPGFGMPTGIGDFDFLDIHFANSTFVAVGASGQVYTANITATTWTQHDILSFADLKGVTSNNGTFVTVGTSGEIWSSTNNGTTWTQQTSGLETTQLGINSVTPAGPGFLAVGDEGHILTSTDGSIWAIPYPQAVTSAPLRDVTFANGIYTAVGDVEAGGNAVILNSLNGSTWTKAAASPAVNNLNGVAFGNGLLVAVGNSGIDLTGDPASRPEILTSSDNGATWAKQTVATTPVTSLNLYGITFGGNQFVAVGDWDFDTRDAVILTSPDGISWTRRTNPSADILRRITYVNGTFVAVGGVGTVLVSTDGINWTDNSLSFGPEFSGVAAKPGTPATLAAVGTNSFQVYRSADDGATWTIASHTPAELPTGVLRGITYANGQFVAVAESGFIFSSTNAVAWTTRMGADIFPFGTRELFSVTFGNGRFLATGFNGAIMQSSADAAAAAQPVLSLSPASFAFAPTEIGITADEVFTITNRGGSNLNVASLTSGNALFTIQNNNCEFALPAGESCTFTVRFSPVAPHGTVTSSALTITSNDPASPATAALNGTSKDTVAQLTITSGPAFFTNVDILTVSGTVEAGSQVTVTVDTAATAGPVLISGAGGVDWSSTISNLATGVNTITVTATDPLGNITVKTATITFDANPFVKRVRDAATGFLIQPLYDSAITNDTLQLRSVTLTESPLFNQPGISVTIEGGYNAGFTAPATGVTVIKGQMIIRQGTVRVNRVVIQ
jgi:alpha-tubulin suppressor-like RCC1 family protein